MFILLLLALILIGVAFSLAVRALAFSHSARTRRLAQIGAYGFDAEGPAPAVGPSLRTRLDALAVAVGELANRYFERRPDTELRRQLSAAGLYRMTPRKFLGYRLIATAALLAFWLWLGLVGSSGAATIILGALVVGAIGWVGPTFWLKRRATARLQQIDHEMPELVDLLVTAVEGGLGFGGSLQLAVRGLEGPLGDELRLALQEQSLGLSTNEALQNLLNRVDTLSVRSFVQAIIQGESLGVSVGKILRDLAKEMRSRRRQMAEEKAHKAGTKIVFPVAVCIFPAMFVVALGPMLLFLSRTFGSL
ncbi:MAG: type II secretion system F family protein [Gaiellaceae bacterium]